MSEKKEYKIKVTREHEESEYSYASMYTIEAPNHTDAEKIARERFCADFGAPYDKTKAFTLNRKYE